MKNMNIIQDGIQCQFQNHRLQKIITVCLNTNCKTMRLCCLSCFAEFHQSHPSDLVALEIFNSFIQQESKKETSHNQCCTYVNSQLIQRLEELLNQIDNLSKVIQKKIQKLKTQNIQEFLKQQSGMQQGLQYWNQFIQDLLKFVEVKNQFITLQNQQQQALSVKEKEQISKIFQFNQDLIQIVKQFVTPYQNKCLKFSQNIIKLESHQKDINGVATSSNGTIIASGSDDNSVKLWNVQTKQLMKTFQYDGSVQGGVALSANNQYLAYGGQGNYSIELHDIMLNSSYATLIGHQSNISSIVFSQDSELLYSGGKENKLIVWNIKQKAQIYSFDTDSIIMTIVNSPDNKLISCICDKSINIWDYQRKVQIIHYKDPHSTGYGLCSTKDQSIFISSGFDGFIKIWKLTDNENGQKSLNYIRKIKASDKAIFKVILTSDEQYIISISNKETKIMIHELESGNLIQELYYGNQNGKYFDGHISISKDMNILVCGGEDKMVKIWTRE